MKNFTSGNLTSEREKLVKELENSKEEKRKRFKVKLKKLKKLVITFLVLFIIGFLFFKLYKYIEYQLSAVLIEEKKYKIVELHTNKDEMKLCFSYVDEDDKIINDYEYISNLDDILYSSKTDESYVLIEAWGHNGEVEREVFSKLYVSEKMYADAYKKIKSED